MEYVYVRVLDSQPTSQAMDEQAVELLDGLGETNKAHRSLLCSSRREGSDINDEEFSFWS